MTTATFRTCAALTILLLTFAAPAAAQYDAAAYPKAEIEAYLGQHREELWRLGRPAESSSGVWRDKSAEILYYSRKAYGASFDDLFHVKIVLVDNIVREVYFVSAPPPPSRRR